MRCAACDSNLNDIDSRARNDVGEFLELCGTCRFWVRTYFCPSIRDDKDKEVWYTAVSDEFEPEDFHGMQRAFLRAERRDVEEGLDTN